MNLIFLYGPPGVGKLTVGKELAKHTGYKLFHNHLTVDLVKSIFEFGSKQFIDLRNEIWMMIFHKAKEEKVDGIIFTFAMEDSVPAEFIPNLNKEIEDDKNKINFVKLTCSSEALRKRISNPTRDLFGKTKNTEKIGEFLDKFNLIPVKVLEGSLVIDNTNLNPIETAKKIIGHFQLK